MTRQPLNMHCRRLRLQDFIQSISLARDFQLRITLGTLEIMVPVSLPLLFRRIFEMEFLGENQDTAGPQTRRNTLQQ